MSESVQIARLTLPIFMGTVMNWALFGVLVVQIYIYFAAFPNDRTRLKLLVVFVLVVEILETIANTRDSIRIFGTGWGNFIVLDQIGWAWFSVPIVGSISACIGQTFFAWRIYIIGQTLYLPVLIVIFQLTVVQLGAGIWTGVVICLTKHFSQLQFHNVPSTATWLATTSLCDLLIVSGMVYYLVISRSPEFRRTNTIITRIVKVSKTLPAVYMRLNSSQITIETGLICALFALVNLYLFTTYKGTNYHLSLCIELSKVYSNSMLLILNSRAHIGHASPHSANHYSLNTSDIMFRSGTTRVPAAALHVGISQTTQSNNDTVRGEEDKIDF
ncbi:hypothetical protein C8R44DRAFT_737819 [Mycena epipterygia]|nr:hypothetical protein C8R44DRAFT_737819 [Mycena epipterygia]